MKIVKLIFVLVASCLLTGCLQWDTTRAVHQWGEDRHDYPPKSVNKAATGPEDWTSRDIMFYSVRGIYYVERIYEINGHLDDSGRVSFFRTRKIAFDQLLMAKQKLLNASYSHSAEGVGVVLWDHVEVNADEAQAVRSSDGHMLRVSDKYYKDPTKDFPNEWQRDCRIMHKGIWEGEESWVVLAEALPRPAKDDPTAKFMSYNPLFVFVNGRHFFKDQPVYLHVAKFPVYVLTVLFDFITAPCQSLAKLRFGP